ncbi:MAG: glucosyltransferase domain-containing protein [bacterium]|nr:glucosyltransferase domain-containing protein [bacterium]
MEKKQYSYAERFGLWLRGLYLENRVPFLAALLTGFAAHMFMFTNKLVNHDEIEALFYKGATVTSGRWGLELSKLLLPNWSMPWIYGLLTLLLISVSVCIMLGILEIRSRLPQILLAAVVVSFPSLTGTYCFMFTSAAYGLAFLLAVLCVWLYQKGGAVNAAFATVSLVLCLSIYQAYIAITASLFVLLMIKGCLEAEKSVWQIVLYGLKALAVMVAALAVYFAVTLLVFRFTGAEFNSYVMENVNDKASLLGKVRMAYENFRDIFTFRNYSLISSEGARYAHIVLLGVILVGLVLAAGGSRPLNWVLLTVLVLLLPLSINCMYLLMSPQSIHTLVLYSFVCLYFLGALILEKLAPRPGLLVKDIMALLMCIIIASNVYFANMTYLKMHLQYENANAFYVSLIAQIKETEGFDENSRLAIIGRQDNLLYPFPELGTDGLLGPSQDLVNIYSRENFFRRYLGFDVPFAGQEELDALSRTAEFEQMAEYPYNGSVKKIGDYIVVKLG